MLCFPTAPGRAQEAVPEFLILDGIKTKMRENLRRLPNYTCTQIIERSKRSKATVN